MGYKNFLRLEKLFLDKLKIFFGLILRNLLYVIDLLKYMYFSCTLCFSRQELLRRIFSP